MYFFLAVAWWLLLMKHETSWAGHAYGIFARVGSVSEIERASAASEWNFWYKQRVQKSRTSALSMKLFINFIHTERTFLLFFRNTSLYLEKMTSEFKKQGQPQTKCPKKYIIRWALQKLWVKILTKTLINNEIQFADSRPSTMIKSLNDP